MSRGAKGGEGPPARHLVGGNFGRSKGHNGLNLEGGLSRFLVFPGKERHSHFRWVRNDIFSHKIAITFSCDLFFFLNFIEL